MVFPDSNPKESKFLILWEDRDGEHFEWCYSINELKHLKKDLEKQDKDVCFAIEIVILKDLTNMEK
jgi:uncharacterized protein YigE (DUF2233 family)